MACSRNAEKRSAYMSLVGKLEEKWPLRKPRHKWADNSKTDLGKIGCGGMDLIGLAQDRDKWRVNVNVVMNFQVPLKAVILSGCTTGGLWSSVHLHNAAECRIHIFTILSRNYKRTWKKAETHYSHIFMEGLRKTTKGLHSCKSMFRPKFKTICWIPSAALPLKQTCSLGRRKKLRGLIPRANYTDRATSACQRSLCQRLRIGVPRS
jgi:hypothetical protein